jgi:hypothetical protein
MDEDERIHLWPDQRKLERSIPLNRLGTPEDIALAVLYMASSASSWVIGKIFEVDGECSMAFVQAWRLHETSRVLKDVRRTRRLVA